MSVPLQIQPVKRPRGGLESVAAPMPLREEEWRTGIQLTPNCGFEPFVWACASDDEKPVTSPIDTVEFQATTIGNMRKCGPNGPRSPIGDIAAQLARNGLERTRWAQLANVLATGDVAGGNVGSFGANPSLQSEAVLAPNTDVTDPKPLDSTLTDVLAGALCADCYMSDLVLHVPQQFLPHFLDDGLVAFDAVSGTYKLGDFDVSFDCYPNLGPQDAEDDQATATDNSEVWIYASARPLAAFGLEDTVSSRQIQQNEYVFEATRGAIIAFDTCCVIAAKAIVFPEVP